MTKKKDHRFQNIVENTKKSIVFLRGRIFGFTSGVGIGFFVEQDKIATNIHVISLPIVNYEIITPKHYEIVKSSAFKRIWYAVKKLTHQKHFRKLRMQDNAEHKQSEYCEAITRYTIEGVAGCDDKNDLVLLKVAETGVPIPVGNNDDLQDGDPVIIIGYKDNIYKGIIGNILSDHNSETQFLIKAKISSRDCEGLSGGPVLKQQG